MKYIEKHINSEVWDCATYGGMCRFVVSGSYYELPTPIEELSDKSNLRVYELTAVDSAKAWFVANDDLRLLVKVYRDKSASIYAATMLPIETAYEELEDKMDNFLNAIEEALGLGEDNCSSSSWAFGYADSSFDYLLNAEEQELTTA